MGSLQEQLLKAGLASKQQLKQNKSQKRKQKKQGKSDEEISLARAYAEKQRQEKLEKDRALNRKREEERQRREINQQIGQLLKAHRKNDPKADISRFFEYGGKIRKLFVTPAQQKALNSSRMGIVQHRGEYHLVELEVLEKIRALKPTAVAFWLDPNEQNPEEEEFPVPDDLMW